MREKTPKRILFVMRIIFIFQSAILLFGGLTPIRSQQVYSRIDSSITYNYRSGPDSVLLKKTVFCHFDSINSNFQSWFYNWNAESELWEPAQKIEIVESKQLRTNTNFLYEGEADTGAWKLFTKEKIDFDTGGNMTGFVQYKQPTGEDLWAMADSSFYEYNGAGDMIKRGSLRWDDSMQVYTPRFRYEFEVNSERDRVLETKYTWSLDGSWEMESSEKNEYTYETDGRIASVTTFLWDIDLECMITMHLNYPWSKFITNLMVKMNGDQLKSMLTHMITLAMLFSK